MSMRPLTGYFFEDYTVGQHFAHATPRTITSGEVALYQALTGSRNPLHCSEPFAQSLGYPAMPVDDLLVFHIAFGKTVADISYNAVANLGYADCRFVAPVFVGDTLRAETEILGLKENSSGKTGVVYVRSKAFNQRDELVLQWIRWVMVNRRKPRVDAGVSAPHGVTDFSGDVLAANLKTQPTLTRSSQLLRVNGNAACWEDFNAVDISLAENLSKPHDFQPILHPAGITIDETDHTLATKLYQNTARVHFDLHHMKDSRFGRRLVYGGHVMSMCRALAFDGLENAFSILAINSGTHHNPVFAGDTLYAMSLPTMKWPINHDFGALRVQLFGYKNIDPHCAAFATAPESAKVLTLDLTLLVPRR